MNALLPAALVVLGALPSAPPGGSWVVDLTQSVDATTLAAVNAIAQRIDDERLGQLGILVLPSTEGQRSRAYATDVFNHWGIGHAGINNGVLVMIAVDDRKAELVVGKKRPLTQAQTDRIMRSAIVANLKKGQLSQGLLQAATEIEGELRQGPKGSDPIDGSLAAVLGLFCSGSVFVVGMSWLLWWNRRGKRTCQRCRQPMRRLNELDDDASLSVGQRKEEELGSVAYDVWRCEACAETRVERYTAYLSAACACAQCQQVTAKRTTRLLVAATRRAPGLVKDTLSCSYCNYQSDAEREILFGQDLDGSSSDSSSSGFGGGSSSGDGSSGSW
jgi:uncharacterized protein